MKDVECNRDKELDALIFDTSHLPAHQSRDIIGSTDGTDSGSEQS